MQPEKCLKKWRTNEEKKGVGKAKIGVGIKF